MKVYRSIEEWEAENFPRKPDPKTPEEFLEDLQRKIEPTLLELARLTCEIISSRGRATEADVKRIAEQSASVDD